MNECVFCINPETLSSAGVERNRVIKQYTHWWLLLQREDKLRTTKQAAGLLVAKHHVSEVSQVSPEAAAELVATVKESAKLLCEKVGSTYTNQETVGFNQGPEAGQTIMHAHVHVLPVSAEDPAWLKVRAGIGGAFEALREKRREG